MLLVLLAALAMQPAPVAQDAKGMRSAEGGRKPVPSGAPQNWITDRDYPMGSRQRREVGTVAFRLDVDAKGQPVACHILRTSGYEMLDLAICPLLMKRAHFAPATDVAGKPVADFYDGRFFWLIPGGGHADLDKLAAEVGRPLPLIVGRPELPGSYAHPALLRVAFFGSKPRSCSVELGTGDAALDAMACEQTMAKIVMPDLAAQIRPRPDSRMVIVGFEAVK